MQIHDEYDVAVIGGGLAGLSVAIRLVEAGHRVVLFEKENYPFHKVCGEYLSMESWNYLVSLGLPLSQMDLPQIKTLKLSSENGNSIEQPLPLGGFGISRYTLDFFLAELAKAKGVHLLTQTKVDAVSFDKKFTVHFHSSLVNRKLITANYCCGSYGKRSNLERQWSKDFGKQDVRKKNYIAVKYHVQANEDRSLIQLHNFKGGYCGFSAVDEDKFCLCYLLDAACVQANGNNLLETEKNVLQKNHHLKRLFSAMEILEGFPITISQINFYKKKAVQQQMLMLGDAAGMVAPLAGNGMSMALHSGKMAAGLIHQYLTHIISLPQMQSAYETEWKRKFSTRFFASRSLQHFFGRQTATSVFVSVIHHLPFLASPLIRLTHGHPF